MTEVAEKVVEKKAKKEKVIKLKVEPEMSETKKRLKDIKTKLMAELPEGADRADLDEFCKSLGFNDFFHVRRLVNLEEVQGFVNTNKYLDGITKLNAIVGDLGIAVQKPERGPRAKNPINSTAARKLLAGETVELNGQNYKLVAE